MSESIFHRSCVAVKKVGLEIDTLSSIIKRKNETEGIRTGWKVVSAQQLEQNTEEQLWSALMVKAQNGDKRAYQELMKQLSEVTSAVLRRRLNHQLDFIDDCAQEVLMAVHEARHTYDPSRPFRPWFFAIVRHKSIDHLRRYYNNAKHVEYSIDESLDELAHSTSDKIDEKMTSEAILNQLPDNQRQAVVLTKLEGKSIKEASAELNVSESALKVRVHRAMGVLKKRFRKQ